MDDLFSTRIKSHAVQHSWRFGDALKGWLHGRHRISTGGRLSSYGRGRHSLPLHSSESCKSGLFSESHRSWCHLELGVRVDVTLTMLGDDEVLLHQAFLGCCVLRTEVFFCRGTRCLGGARLIIVVVTVISGLHHVDLVLGNYRWLDIRSGDGMHIISPHIEILFLFVITWCRGPFDIADIILVSRLRGLLGFRGATLVGEYHVDVDCLHVSVWRNLRNWLSTWSFLVLRILGRFLARVSFFRVARRGSLDRAFRVTKGDEILEMLRDQL